MKVKGHFKSEAEAYQAMRKEWKHRRNIAQREASIHQWELEHGEVHPQVRRMVAHVSHITDVHMPINRPEVARAAMKECQYWVGRYQFMLNKFKVKDES